MSDWQNAFTSYTTGTAFSIGLSHDQVSLMAYVGAGKYDQWSSRSGHHTFIPCVHALIRRGLVEHNPVMKAGLPKNVKAKWVYRLTPAGKHVLELLKLAGLVPVLVVANQDCAA